MQLDIPSLSYSDALVYIEDFLSKTPTFGISENDFFVINTSYNLGIELPIEIWTLWLVLK